jgi:hypothetical protein
VDLSNRRRAQRAALVRRTFDYAATLVGAVVLSAAVMSDHTALVPQGSAVVHKLCATAVVSAHSQGGVERVENLRVESTDHHGPQQRSDMLVDVSDIRSTRGLLHIDYLKVPVQELVDRRSRARVALFVHLVTKPCVSKLTGFRP